MDDYRLIQNRLNLKRVVVVQPPDEGFERPPPLAVPAPLFSLGGAGEAAHLFVWFWTISKWLAWPLETYYLLDSALRMRPVSGAPVTLEFCAGAAVCFLDLISENEHEL